MNYKDDCIRVELSEGHRGKSILNALLDEKIIIDSPCNGGGRCRKCVVYLENDGEFKPVLSCQTFCKGEGAVYVPKSVIINGKSCNNATAAGDKAVKDAIIVCDIGTTTVEFALIDRVSGEKISSYSVLNPQKSHGADVLSRITYAENGGLNRLQKEIVSAINTASEHFALSCNVRISEIYVTGNTTMLHLLAGTSPSGIGRYPFVPEFTDAKKLCGDEIGINAENVTLFPSADAFIGADVVCGMYCCGFHLEENRNKNLLLTDLGTNGECVLKAGDKFYSASAAAGPCLEGAGISCGVGGIEGAICRFFYEKGKLCYSTIGDKKPVGICGAGLTELIALLLERGIIDESGYMESDYPIAEGELSLTPDDVRQFQLAKAAIYATVCTLVKEAGITFDYIDTVYIAGGLGKHLSVSSATKTGLLPYALENKIIGVGNSALKGACGIIKDGNALEVMGTLSKKVKTLSLNESGAFSELFIDSMGF